MTNITALAERAVIFYCNIIIMRMIGKQEKKEMKRVIFAATKPKFNP